MSFLEPVVAVFDTKTMALRAVTELRAAEFDDIWLGVVRGETAEGQTLVATDDMEDIVANVLVARGTPVDEAGCFDGILPPGTTVMSLCLDAKRDDAIRIVELAGGHVEHP